MLLKYISMKICVPSETKEVNIKLYNMITRVNEAKTMVKHITCNSKTKFDSTTCNSNHKWNTVMVNIKVSTKSIVHAKKIIDGILAHVFVRMVSI